MCFFMSLVPATIFVVIGFFVMFAAARSEGGSRTFGRILAVWLFVLAAFFPVCGAYVTINGLCPVEHIMGTMESPGQPDMPMR